MIAYDYWQDQPWTAVRDPAAAFASDTLKAALAVWQAHAWPIPLRSALDARVLKPFLGYVVIAERTEPHRYRIRLMGSSCALIIGEMQGHMLDECLPHDAIERWCGAFDTVLAELRPCRYLADAVVREVTRLNAELLVAPLLDAARNPTLVLVVADVQSGRNLQPAPGGRA